jgi:hypothetical protein
MNRSDTGLNQYVNEIGRIPVLMPQQEIELSGKIKMVMPQRASR